MAIGVRKKNLKGDNFFLETIWQISNHYTEGLGTKPPAAGGKEVWGRSPGAWRFNNLY